MLIYYSVIYLQNDVNQMNGHAPGDINVYTRTIDVMDQ